MDGLYLSFSNEIMVCRVTPSRLASCCCVSPRALRFSAMQFFIYTPLFKKVKLALHQHYNACVENVKLILHLCFKFYVRVVGYGFENAPDEAGSTERFDRDAGEYRKIRETGWEPEREVFFRLQGADRDYEERPDHNPERYEESAFGYGAGSTEENPTLRMDLNRGSDLVRDAVRLGRAVEQMTDDAPKRDGTTTSLHIDSKRRKKLKQKKTALGHAEDDHEEMRMDTM